MDKVKIILVAAVAGIGVQFAFSIYWTMIGIGCIMFFECLYFLFASPEEGFNRKGTQEMIEQSWWSFAMHIVCAVAMFVYADMTDKLAPGGYIEYWDNGDLDPERVRIPHQVWNYLVYFVTFRIVMQFAFIARIRRRGNR